MKLLALVVALGLTAAACERTTSEQIQTWKGTEKGPSKLEDTLRSANVPAGLRAEAAAALVDIGRADKVDEIMASVPSGERSEVLKTLMEIYIKGMASPQLPKVRDARDGLFSLRQYAPADEQKRIDQVLLASIEKDLFDGRLSGGRHSLEKMLPAIGTAAGPMLVRLLGDPKAPYRGLAELLVKVADAETRDKGGAALIGRMSPGKPMLNDLWISLGMIGGPTVTEFLLGKMQKGSAEDAVAAARALQQSRFPAALPVALKIAGDPKASGELRDEAFGVVERVGGPEAQKGLVKIIAEDKNEKVRYRAHEAALVVGKGEAIRPALEAFSPKLSFKREDVVDFLVKDISKIGPQAKPYVLATLGSPSALARMVAVLALEAPVSAALAGHLGGAEDAAALLRLGDDKATVKGFPAGASVGTEAKRVAVLLGSKGK